MSKLEFSTVAILITAASWAGFALWLGMNPGAFLPAFGVEESTPQMLTEVRAFYGGVEMAIAVAMIVLWRRGDLFASLLVGGLPLWDWRVVSRCSSRMARAISLATWGTRGSVGRLVDFADAMRRRPWAVVVRNLASM
jgi:hypothetical protein